MTAPLTEHVEIILAGHPQGKGRARSFLQQGRIVTTTPPQTRSYEGMIRHAAMEAMRGRLPTEAPVEVWMTAVLVIPKSYSGPKRAAALRGDLRPTTRPDLDNVAKAFQDAMNGVVYRDDSQIVKTAFVKVYGEKPGVYVTVKPLPAYVPQPRRKAIRAPSPNIDESKSALNAGPLFSTGAA